MKYMQGPDGLSLREEVVVKQNFPEGHPPDFYRFRLLEPIRKLQSNRMLTVPKLKQLYEEAFVDLFKVYPPPGWTSGYAPARASVSYKLPAALIADVMKAR